jgi:hypothetical protein
VAAAAAAAHEARDLDLREVLAQARDPVADLAAVELELLFAGAPAPMPPPGPTGARTAGQARQQVLQLRSSTCVRASRERACRAKTSRIRPGRSRTRTPLAPGFLEIAHLAGRELVVEDDQLARSALPAAPICLDRPFPM